MKLKEAMRLCRVSEKTMLAVCTAGQFGARKRGGQWWIPNMPFIEPARSPEELASLIGVSGRFVRRLCHDGRIQSFRIGKQIRIDQTEVDKIVEARRVDVADINL
jgi:excisionase family DNA binding protein